MRTMFVVFSLWVPSSVVASVLLAPLLGRGGDADWDADLALVVGTPPAPVDETVAV
jgi:hypothetical protein